MGESVNGVRFKQMWPSRQSPSPRAGEGWGEGVFTVGARDATPSPRPSPARGEGVVVRSAWQRLRARLNRTRMKG